MQIYREAKEKISHQLEKDKHTSHRIGVQVLIRLLKILGMNVTYILYTAIGAMIYKILEPYSELGASSFALVAFIGSFAVFRI